MEGQASVKVSGGKLVRVHAAYDTAFEDVNITGDFFLEPPKALQELEKAVEGLSVDTGRHVIVDRLEDIDARLIGFSREDVADALLEVVDR
jgi:lipoate-protein ligase A